LTIQNQRTNRREFLRGLGYTASAFALAPAALAALANPRGSKPNIVIILSDDVGYGDLGCYGGVGVNTPHIDGLAKSGRRFTNAHSDAATCTPSRYAMLTGSYAWRHDGVQILPGDAKSLIEPGQPTVATVLKSAGYATGLVGKWHIGLGDGTIDWNGEIKPGPCELGFDDAFFFPATADRVPTVYIHDHRVVNLEPLQRRPVILLKLIRMIHFYCTLRRAISMFRTHRPSHSQAKASVAFAATRLISWTGVSAG
jgi:arylsulfatase A-like enzyme